MSTTSRLARGVCAPLLLSLLLVTLNGFTQTANADAEATPAPTATSPVDTPATTATAPATSSFTLPAPPPTLDSAPLSSGSPPLREHAGFFFRGAIGGGYSSLPEGLDPGGLDRSVSGSGYAFVFDLGGALSPGLAMVLSIAGTSIEAPNVSEEESLAGISEEPRSIGMLGAKLEWFPNPLEGLHLSGTVGAFKAFGENDTGETDVGPGVAGEVGYAFWIHRIWSAGFVLHVGVGSISKDGQSGIVKQIGLLGEFVDF